MKNSVCITSIFCLLPSLINFSCKSTNDPSPPVATAPVVTITVNPSTVYQEMVGFGGALSWYSNWITASANKIQIADLIFSDLGIDIVRMKNWYYPDNYPAVTGTDVMSYDNSKVVWDATNDFYTLAKARNSKIKILLSSWGPPAALKKDGVTNGSTLKKDGNGVFMYDAFADYWVNILDHLPFNPDYISIQNEPTYTNSGWTTCQWAATETTDVPSYITAFDKIYDKIKNRTNPPILIGPESQDIPTFSDFATLLKTKAYCGMLAYHPYNITSTNSANQVTSLQTIGSFTTKPNIMTEYSDNLSWFNTAVFIQNALLYANSSGYIYWKLAWATPTTGATDAGMISITSGGTYTATPYYYLIKHFAKNIDAGHKRVDASSSNATLITSAFINPAGNKLTLIVINTSAGTVNVGISALSKTITTVSGNQSMDGSYYKPLVITSPTESIALPGQSITTIVLDI